MPVDPLFDLALDKALCEKSLRDFARAAWSVVEPSTPLVWGGNDNEGRLIGWHLDAIAEHLQAVTAGQIRNLAIAVPPGHMKSLLTSVFWPAWEWTTHPEIRWLFASYAASLSIRDSVKCRRVIESDWYQGFWGSAYKVKGPAFSSDGQTHELTNDQNAKVKFENDKTGFRLATSVGGSGTGERANRVVADDPHNVSERESIAKRTAVLDWWDNTYSNRLCDYQRDCRVTIHQRVNEKDLIGHLLARGGVEYLCLPTEFEPHRRSVTSIGWSDPRTRPGELLFPHRFGPKEVAEAKATLGPTGYASQQQQLPSPSGGGRFKESYFRLFETSAGTPPVPGEGGPDEYILTDGRSTWRVKDAECQRFAIMDPAGTDKDQNAKACYTVIQIWAVAPSHHMLLLHQYREQVETPDAADAAVELARSWDCAWLGIEKDGIGLGIVQHAKRRQIAVRAIKARGSKEARSETAEIWMAAGRIFFPKGAVWLPDLMHELVLFPNGEFKDQVDCVAHAALQVQRIAGAAPVPVKHHGDPVMDDAVLEEQRQLAEAAAQTPGGQIPPEAVVAGGVEDDPEVIAWIQRGEKPGWMK